jgi:hypothetical protein
MKGHKEHHHRGHHAHGGSPDAKAGDKEWEADLKEKTHDRVSDPEIDKEAEERKHGGRAKRKRGGSVHHVHHEHGKHMAHAKHVGEVKGHKAHHHAGRKPRARGGSNDNPLSSAHAGVLPKHHKDADID